MVMPANHSSPSVHYWAGAHKGRIGWLVGPSAMPKTKLRKWMPFALDNDAYSAWEKQKPWDEEAWVKMLNTVWVSKLSPLWVLVPDVVADRAGTLEKWNHYQPLASRYGWPLAFAVQDGMTPSDVPGDADVVFVGGTTEWKWRTVKTWASNFPRVHVGRVNSIQKLWDCEKLGIESVDGTGWFRDSEHNGKALLLEHWIEGNKDTQNIFSFYET